DLWVLSDECYAGFTYDTPHVSATALDADDRVLTLDTFSKTYAMTGFRVGSLLVPRAFDAFLPRVQEALVSCVNTPAQYGALAALTGPQDDVGRAADIYRLHRDTATRLLEARGFTVLPARGGIYLWVDLSHASAGDVHDLARRLVTERGVAVAPGSAFGAQGEGWVRVSLTASEADLVEGLSRLPAPRG
ncbi:MAG: pyridoxal phosphate-dependent aminotransferase, partial [Cellulomonadaceae bacterium]